MALENTKICLLDQTDSRLTGNFKIVVEPDLFWLSTFDNIVKFEDIKYKKYKPSYQLNYFYDLYNFLQQDTFSTDAIWGNLDLSQFSAGPSKTLTTYFDGNYKYLAPLWIRKDNIPDYFFIVETEGSFTNQYTSSKSQLIYNSLRNGKIIYSYNIKDSLLGKYLNNTSQYTQEKLYDYKDTTNKEYLTLYGINYINGLQIEKLAILDEAYKGLSDDDVAELFKSNQLLTSSIINLEFIFKYKENEEFTFYEDYHSYHNLINLYGFYCNISDLTNLNIDLNILNTKIDTQVGKIYQVMDKNSIFINSIQDTLKLPVYSYANDVSIDSNYLYFLENKYKEFTNISSIETANIVLNTNSYDLSGIFGYDLDSAKEIPGVVFSGNNIQSLLFSVIKDTNQLFNNGDYLTIYSTTLANSEWRVIANNDTCCGDTDICYFNSPSITFKSNDFNLIELQNSEDYHYHYSCYHYGENTDSYPILLVATVDGYLDIEENVSIQISWEECGNTKIESFLLSKVEYDSTLNKTYLYVLDDNADYLKYLYLVSDITFLYHDISYKYTYFNAEGSIEDILMNICDAFNSFDDKKVGCTYVNNKILFKSLLPGNAFSTFKFKYNFSNSNTLVSNFSVNERELQGIKIYDDFNVLKVYSKVGTYDFSYASNSNTNHRFYVDKQWGLENINCTELIATKKKSLSPLKISYAEGNPICHQPFLNNLKYVDKYLTYQIEDSYDDIMLSSSKKITAYSQFYPKIDIVDLISTEKLYSTGTFDKCKYDTLVVVGITQQLIALNSITLDPFAIKNKLDLYVEKSGQFRLLSLEQLNYQITLDSTGQFITEIRFSDILLDYISNSDNIYICYDKEVETLGALNCSFALDMTLNDIQGPILFDYNACVLPNGAFYKQDWVNLYNTFEYFSNLSIYKKIAGAYVKVEPNLMYLAGFIKNSENQDGVYRDGLVVSMNGADVGNYTDKYWLRSLAWLDLSLFSVAGSTADEFRNNLIKNFETAGIEGIRICYNI